MDPAELRLFKQKVAEFERTVNLLITSHPHQHQKHLRKISAQQLFFKDRPWVSHFVPHLNVVRKRLSLFQDNASHPPVSPPASSQPASQPVSSGQMSLLAFFSKAAAAYSTGLTSKSAGFEASSVAPSAESSAPSVAPPAASQWHNHSHVPCRYIIFSPILVPSHGQ